MSEPTLTALLLGFLEGLTEFLPVSSTGHLLLAGHFLGFQSTGKTFEVVIQLGAILAILGVYAGKLIGVLRAAPHDPAAREFLLSVLIAFLPAMVVGVLAHDFIKSVLFETPKLIAGMLVVGGVILLVVDRLPLEPSRNDAMRFPLPMALTIGVLQCLAMVPGVSRSGATIVGALLMGATKRAAAEFSFFLSMPTMAAAFSYDLWKNRDVLDGSAMGQIGLGFLAALVTAVIVVRTVLTYLTRHGFALFGWWRIIVGSAALAALYAGN
jgi:undecaprenyl-diphosphatase